MARGRVVDRFADQTEGTAAFGRAEVGAQAQDDLGRVVVREEVGQLRLRGAARAAQVEDDGGEEFGVADRLERW